MKPHRFTMMFIMLCLPTLSFAWDASGHRLVAEIAYQNLEPQVKKTVIRYTDVLNRSYRHERFSMSASWPDEIKVFHDVKAFNQWHYINLPFGNVKPVVIEKQNIIWALGESRTVLKSRRSNPLEKSFFLRFFIHLVGDIHQPLHCYSVYSTDFPQGDAGGGLFKLDDPQYKTLHELWDAGGGVFSQYAPRLPLRNKALTAAAQSLMQQYPASEFKSALAVDDFDKWANESYQLAHQYTHQLSPGGKPSAAYLTQTQQISQRQIVLAGYRLAQQLNTVFKEAE